jgi:hypothetical protein
MKQQLNTHHMRPEICGHTRVVRVSLFHEAKYKGKQGHKMTTLTSSYGGVT